MRGKGVTGLEAAELLAALPATFGEWARERDWHHCARPTWQRVLVGQRLRQRRRLIRSALVAIHLRQRLLQILTLDYRLHRRPTGRRAFEAGFRRMGFGLFGSGIPGLRWGACRHATRFAAPMSIEPPRSALVRAAEARLLA